MVIFQYQILVGKNEPNAVVWFLNGNQLLGADLLQILNGLVSQGWEFVGIGDLGFDSRSEIVLKKTI
ncbi:MAG: hypothetical protein ACKPA9_33070 [Microcystis sp.]